MVTACGMCGGRVRLEFDALSRVPVGTVQAWICPHCFGQNHGNYPAVLTAVDKA